MIVRVNSKQKEIPLETSLKSLVNRLNISSKGIAIALNETIIPKHTWEETLLSENDDIIIIVATQGG